MFFSGDLRSKQISDALALFRRINCNLDRCGCRFEHVDIVFIDGFGD